tara:strand:- start:277 stop:807 length:531 start_codon:yes stop_codon:yes gene_type:complete
MKMINERLRVAEYEYPLASKLNPELHQIILGLPDAQQRRVSLKAKMTEWRTENKKFDIVKEFVKKFIIRDFSNGEVICSECWAALYNKGDHTDIHNHEPSFFSFVYYVNTPKGSSPLIFDTSGYKIKPISGRLVIFDSKLNHRVPTNRCDGRSVISGNFIYKQLRGVHGDLSSVTV